ncbi:MAG TPA: iron-containing alcohol dehydrogenase [Candidatus Acidoferrum sp.]|nr:iron-containing alcohol dehydrogenase [Candidatus Acidoferrum sp.]
MEAIIADFNLSKLERVMSGPGKVAAVGEELERRGLQRAIVVTGKTLGASRLLDRVTGAAGSRCAAVFKGAHQHVPRSTVNELQALIEQLGADSLVSFGGGSPIDTCKVASHAFLGKPAAAGGREIIHIAIPTTLSAGEYTHAGGVTDETTLVKSGVSDPRLQARTVINDPEVTLETPEWLWVATGMRALDHAIETIYTPRHHPLSDALGAKAISLLVEHLPASIKTRGAEQLAHRGYCQFAAWFSIYGSMNTRFGISHLLGHQIGPRWNVAHGVTSCITLPHAMRFMADIAPERFAPIAEGFRIPFDPRNPRAGALACAERTAQFIAQFDVPNSLKKAGVPRAEVGQIVPTVLHELEKTGVVDRSVTAQEVTGLLEAAY